MILCFAKAGPMGSEGSGKGAKAGVGRGGSRVLARTRGDDCIRGPGIG